MDLEQMSALHHAGVDGSCTAGTNRWITSAASYMLRTALELLKYPYTHIYFSNLLHSFIFVLFVHTYFGLESLTILRERLRTH
jgi:hypothetical protein